MFKVHNSRLFRNRKRKKTVAKCHHFFVRYVALTALSAVIGALIIGSKCHRGGIRTEDLVEKGLNAENNCRDLQHRESLSVDIAVPRAHFVSNGGMGCIRGASSADEDSEVEWTIGLCPKRGFPAPLAE